MGAAAVGCFEGEVCVHFAYKTKCGSLWEQRQCPEGKICVHVCIEKQVRLLLLKPLLLGATTLRLCNKVPTKRVY